MSALTETEINIRKQTLQGDLDKVKDSLKKLDDERVNLVAQHHAISGAIQQCDLFLEDLNWCRKLPTVAFPRMKIKKRVLRRKINGR